MSLNEMYTLSNIAFLFDQEEEEIITETDERDFKEVILNKEEILEELKGNLEEIKNEFINRAEEYIWNVIKDKDGYPNEEFYFYELEKEYGLLSYIFEEVIKEDLEYFIEENFRFGGDKNEQSN